MKRFLRYFKNTNKKKTALQLSTALVVALAGVYGAMFASTKIAEAKMARDCDNNAIVYCGTVNTSEFVSKYKANTKHDLDNIYNAYGLSPSELSRFQKTAKMGYVTKSGNVVLNGKVVGTHSRSLGRQYIPGSSTKWIDGHKYYERATSVSFVSNSIPALIMMNGDQVEFVALTSCGNPVKTTPKGKPPVYKCNMLNKQAVSGKDDTFAFSTNVTADHGAKVSRVVYDFGDGSAKVTKTNPNDKVTHTYKPGKFTAKVTAYFTVNGETKAHTSTNCTKPVEVKQPPQPVFECTALTAKVVPPSKNKYSFTATAKAENGATLQSGSFDFGDGQKQDNVAANGKTVTTEHEYAKDGSYTAAATLKFNVGGTSKEAKCSVKVTPEVPKPPVYECTALSVMQKSRTEFSFKASSKVENAELLRYRYVLHTSEGVLSQELGPNETYNYTAEKEGTYSITAQAIVKVDGVEKETPITDACSKTFNVTPEEQPPVAECVALTATLRSDTKDTYDYAVATKVEGNAKVVSYLYDYGDGNQQTLNTSTASHTYERDGQWKTRVTVTFEVDGKQVQKTSDACMVETPVQPTPPEECKPGIPVGDERCQEKPQECKPGIPVGDDRCEEKPAELPQTGMNALGGALGFSSLAGAGYYWRNSRRNLLDKLFNRK